MSTKFPHRTLVIYLDTHVVAWLYAGRVDLLSEKARSLLRESPALVSPMVRLELDYLCEVGRTSEPGETVLSELSTAIGLKVCQQPFEGVVDQASDERWTRDPFDRLIVAQAKSGQSPLLTKDRSIRDHYRWAVWN